MHYDNFSTDQQKAALDTRLAQFEREHFDHSMNLMVLEASGLTDEATETAKEQARKAVAHLEATHTSVKAERSHLDAATPATPGH